MNDEQKIILKGFAALMCFFVAIIVIAFACKKEVHRIDTACKIDRAHGYPVTCDVD